MELRLDDAPVARAAAALRLAAVDPAGPDLAADGAATLLEHLRQEAPQRSGRLRRSIQAGPSGPVVDLWGLAYGALLARGTRPHPIRPRGSLPLVFRSGGRLVFARLVHHPGTRPDDFPRRAADAATPALRALLRRRAQQLAQRRGGPA